MAITRLMIVDDHALVRRSLRALLTRIANLEVVGEASDGQEAVEMVTTLQPDLVLMDISMPRLDGIAAAHRILNSQNPPQIIMLSMYADASLTRRALDIGVQGVLLKIHTFEELFTAIQQVRTGKVVISSELKALPGLASHLGAHIKAVGKAA